MAEGHGWGGASRADSNHPAPACANAAPPYPRRGVLLVLMSPCLAVGMSDRWLVNLCDALNSPYFGVTFDFCHYGVARASDQARSCST
jgi:hypothetical protein